MKENEIREKLKELRLSRDAINKQIADVEAKCEHKFKNGYTLEPVVYCTICDKEATELFPNMSYKHIEKLIEL